MPRELIYYVAVSLDGRTSGPGDDWSAFPVEGDHFAHLIEHWPDTFPTAAHAPLGITPSGRFDTVLMGWNTYAVGLPTGVVSPYQHLRQLVFSGQPRTAGADAELSAEDPIEVVRRLKAEPGADLWLCGGGRLAATLIDQIDRLVLKVQPVTLGAGPSLFEGDHRPRHWTRAARHDFASGVCIEEHLPSSPQSPAGA